MVVEGYYSNSNICITMTILRSLSVSTLVKVHTLTININFEHMYR